jgi:hypothetical protein
VPRAPAFAIKHASGDVLTVLQQDVIEVAERQTSSADELEALIAMMSLGAVQVVAADAAAKGWIKALPVDDSVSLGE